MTDHRTTRDDLVDMLLRRTDAELLDDETADLCDRLQAWIDATAIGPDGHLVDDQEALRAVAGIWWQRRLVGASAPEPGTVLRLFAAASDADLAGLPAGVDIMLRRYADRPEVAAARPIRHADLAVRMLVRALDLDDWPLLDTAVAALRLVVAELPAGRYETSANGNLGIALRERYSRRHEDRDITDAIAAHQRAIAATPPADAQLAGRLAMLGHAWHERYDWVGDPDSLEAAVRSHRAALLQAAPDHPDGTAITLAYTGSLCERATLTGDIGGLDEAAGMLRPLADRAGREPDAMVAAVLAAVATVAMTRYHLTSAVQEVTEAVEALTRAVAVPSINPRQAVTYQGNLGTALLTRYMLTGRLDDLDEADTWLAAASTGADPGPDQLLRRGTLAAVWLRRFERTGETTLLTDALDMTRRVLDGLPAEHPGRPGVLTNLAALLFTRFELLGEPADLDEAVERAGQAVDTTPISDPRRPDRVAGFAAGLRARFVERRELADLDAAVRALRPTVDTLGSASARCAAALGSTLLLRFDIVGERSDLDDAVQILADVVATQPDQQPDWAGYASEYGRALLVQHEVDGRADPLADGDAEDLVRSTSLLGRAADRLPPGHPHRAACLMNLAIAHRAAFRTTGSRPAFERALASYAVAYDEVGGAARVRYQAAVSGGQLAMESGHEQAALCAFETAVALLPRLAWHGLQRGKQERILAAEGGTVTDAAVVAIRLGRYDRALELLEQGRGVLWTQRSRSHDDLAELQAADPARAAALRRVVTALDLASPGPSDTVADDARRAPPGRDADHRVRLSAELDRLLTEIRRDSRFVDFWAAPSAVRLCEAATEGPVVVPMASRYGAYALVVRAGQPILPVKLPDLEADDLLNQARRYVTVLSALRSGDAATRRVAGRHLDGVLAWLWRTVAALVLEALESTPSEHQDLRLWWCPTGLLALLPIHAAQYFDRVGLVNVGVADHVVSSYTPTLRHLVAARAKAAAPVESVLAVGLRRTRGQAELPQVVVEVAAVRAALAGPVEVIFDEEATLGRVRERMVTAQWLHFAGHSQQDLDVPGNTCLMLADAPLTIDGIGALDLPRAQMAFLSSCESSVGSPSLPDEALHLAGALLIAGFGQVLSTRWAVPDEAAGQITVDVYRALCPADDPPTAAGAARALHAAMTKLRRTQPAFVWAAYCHTGG